MTFYNEWLSAVEDEMAVNEMAPQRGESARSAVRRLLAYERQTAVDPHFSEAAAKLVEAKDAAYAERNRVVAALACVFPAGIARTEIPGWDPAWHNCVYINLPTGQVSWHYHDREAHLFDHLPAYAGVWDGHTTAEKYERLAALRGQA